MNNIFSGIQQFFINVITLITSAILVISPFDKPQVQPTPTQVSIQEVKKATLSATPATEVKGISTKESKVTPTPKPKIPEPTLQQASSPESTRISTPVPAVNSIYQPPVAQPIKKDYSSYRVSLEAALNSLKSRLTNIQFSAEQLPQSVDNQIATIELRLESDLAQLESEYNSNALVITRDYGRRGIPISSGMVQNDLNALKATYDTGRINLIANAEQDKQKVIDDAKNQVYQVDAKDKDLSNKISYVEGLITRINSGTFTDIDIPLAVQAMSY